MRFDFKKISAIASSVLLTSMTIGVAAAANYPAPFVVGSTADVAVVYGTGTGVSSLDEIEAGNIQLDLQGSLTSGGGESSAVGGDSFMFEKTNTKFHLGDGIDDVVSTALDEDELGDLLADGVFVDDDNDEFDFTQEISMADLEVTYFENNDYARDEPVIGVEIEDGEEVLNYTLEFTDNPKWEDLETSELTMMGRTYYILDADNSSNNKLTLLDSAVDTVLNEGEAKTVLGHDVSLSFIGSTEVKFVVDGQTTNALGEGETQKLSDGSYIGVKEILVQDYQGGQKQVEFSIGSGKLVLEDGQAVELNDDDIDEITVDIVNSSGNDLESITLQWATDDDEFITETSEITMPGFEAVKLSYGGLVVPLEEVIDIDNDGDDLMVLSDFPMKDTDEDIVLLKWNSSTSLIIAIGEDTDKQLVTSDGAYIEFDADDDEWAVVSWNDGDDAESYLIRATSFNEDDDVNYTTIQYRKDGGWVDAKEDAENGDDVSIGSVEIDITQINDDDKTVNISSSDADVNFNTLFSAEGLTVNLPVAADINMSADSTYDLVFDEEDEDGNLEDGTDITVVLGVQGTDNESEVNSVSITGTDSGALEESDDLYVTYAYTALATRVEHDQGPDQNTAKIVYHGDEVKAQLYITAPEVTVSAGDVAGVVVVKDSEVSSVSGKNLVVVGGSCINSVAANLVGGALCGPAFTSATGVGSGQFLIESMDSPYDASKVAVLVAGYEVDDTKAASAYLRTQDVDTSVGKKYVGTSSTSAELVVE